MTKLLYDTHTHITPLLALPAAGRSSLCAPSFVSFPPRKYPDEGATPPCRPFSYAGCRSPIAVILWADDRANTGLFICSKIQQVRGDYSPAFKDPLQSIHGMRQAERKAVHFQ